MKDAINNLENAPLEEYFKKLWTCFESEKESYEMKVSDKKEKLLKESFLWLMFSVVCSITVYNSYDTKSYLETGVYSALGVVGVIVLLYSIKEIAWSPIKKITKEYREIIQGHLDFEIGSDNLEQYVEDVINAKDKIELREDKVSDRQNLNQEIDELNAEIQQSLKRVSLITTAK